MDGYDPGLNGADQFEIESDFDDLMDTIELTRDVEISRREIAEGKGIPHAQVMAEMDALIDRVAAKRK